jgi:hypothetical protein
LNKGGSLGRVKPRGGNQWVKVKNIRNWKGGSEELFKESMKAQGLGIMRKNWIGVVIVENFNLVLSKVTRGAKMEIL